MDVFTRSYKYLVFILPILLISIVPSFGFAQDSTKEVLFGNIDAVLSFLSRAWIIPASIAGKLMTNAFVYGSSFYLDVYLFRFRTYMRTLAMYALGFIFVFKILLVYVKQEGTSKIWEIVKNVFIAGLLIPMSWYLVAALVDISIVGTAAVSSFPLQVMQQQWNLIEDDIVVNERIIVVDKDINISDKNREDNIKTLELQDILPQGDSVAGPLVFIGAGLMHFFNLRDIATGESSWAKLGLMTLLKLIITLMLVVPMFALVVVNLMRIFFLWMWIILGPFIILDGVFKGPLTGGEHKDKFSVSSILGLIFQPVAVVGLLSLSMVLILGMYDVARGGDQYEQDAMAHFQVERIGDNKASIGADANSEVFILGEFFNNLGDNVAGAVGELILAALICVIFWALLMVGFKFSALTSGVADSIFKAAGNLAKTVPILPIGAGGKLESVSTLQRAKKDFMRDNMGLNKRIAYQKDRINQALGVGQDTLSNSDLQELSSLSTNTNVGASYGRFWKELKKSQKERGSVTLSDVQGYITSWTQSAGGLNWLKQQKVLPADFEPTNENLQAIWTDSRFATFQKFVDGMLKMSPSQLETFGDESPAFITTALSLGQSGPLQSRYNVQGE